MWLWGVFLFYFLHVDERCDFLFCLHIFCLFFFKKNPPESLGSWVGGSLFFFY